jgi:RES domain-containing protein
LRFSGEAFRAHDPRWSWTPLSGAGAALRGGRFNWRDLEALYLSLNFMTAAREAAGGFLRRLEPLTMVSYDVDCEDIVDLRTNRGREANGVNLSDLGCSWLEDVCAGREPPSWRIVRRLFDDGAAGILVPSFANGAQADDHNLVLWRWGPNLPHKVSAYDPSGRLPTNQLSWP